MQLAEQMEAVEPVELTDPDAEETPEVAPYVAPQALIIAVAEAMKPTGFRDRLRIRLAGGLTVFQVMDRLPEPLLDELREGYDIPVLARRHAIHCIEHALYELCQQQRVRRERVDMAMDLPGKGIRGVRIDAYKLI